MCCIDYLDLILDILKNFKNIFLSPCMKTYPWFINKKNHLPVSYSMQKP